MKYGLIITLILLQVLFSGCGVNNEEKGPLAFTDRGTSEVKPGPAPSPDSLRPKVVKNEKKIKVLENKLVIGKAQLERRIAWDELVKEARAEFQTIRPIIKKKCFACHNSDKKLPFYGKIFPKKNIIARHYRDGIAALDFFEKFPLKSKGNSSQMFLLKAIRAAVVERTMPLKIYRITTLRRITKKDEVKILAWVDPLMEKIKEFEQSHQIPEDLPDIPDEPDNLDSEVAQIFKTRMCLDCHGNGASRDGFGNMENLASIIAGPHVDKENPEKSHLYTEVFQGKMPPPRFNNPLTPEESQVVLDWITERSVK